MQHLDDFGLLPSVAETPKKPRQRRVVLPPKGSPRPMTPEVEAMATYPAMRDSEGYVAVPPAFRRALRLPGGSVDYLAGDILGEICYWFSPKENGDRRFAGDQLQFCAAEFARKNGESRPHRVGEALARLEAAGLITRTLMAPGRGCRVDGNSQFIQLHPEKLKALFAGETEGVMTENDITSNVDFRHTRVCRKSTEPKTDTHRTKIKEKEEATGAVADSLPPEIPEDSREYDESERTSDGPGTIAHGSDDELEISADPEPGAVQILASFFRRDPTPEQLEEIHSLQRHGRLTREWAIAAVQTWEHTRDIPDSVPRRLRFAPMGWEQLLSHLNLSEQAAFSAALFVLNSAVDHDRDILSDAQQEVQTWRAEVDRRGAAAASLCLQPLRCPKALAEVAETYAAGRRMLARAEAALARAQEVGLAAGHAAAEVAAWDERAEILCLGGAVQELPEPVRTKKAKFS